jgi:hypothetical protein
MLSAEAVLVQFRKRAKRFAGEIYVGLDDALELARVCADNDLALFSLEGGFWDGKVFRADPGMIFDGSATGPMATWGEKRNSCNTAALEFLRQLPRRDDLLLIPDIISEKEWAEWKQS